VYLAARGLREDDDGRIAGRLEQPQLTAVRRQALAVIGRAALTALVLTGTAYLAARPSFLPRPRE
jgi:hypothetical protein